MRGTGNASFVRSRIFTSRAPKRRLVRRAGLSPMHLSLTDVVAKALGELWQLIRLVVHEPFGQPFVQSRPVFASDALICSKPDQRVAKAEPVRAHTLDQALALERIEMTFDEVLGIIRQKRTHRVMPKVHADDGCAAQNITLARPESVQTHRQQTSKRAWDHVCVIVEGGEQLLGEQRVALRGFDDLAPDLRGYGSGAFDDEALEISRGQWSELQGVKPFPLRPVLEQIVARDAQQKHSAGRLTLQKIDEIQKRWFGPVQILEHDDQWAFMGDDLEQPAHRGKQGGCADR